MPIRVTRSSFAMHSRENSETCIWELKVKTKTRLPSTSSATPSATPSAEPDLPRIAERSPKPFSLQMQFGKHRTTALNIDPAVTIDQICKALSSLHDDSPEVALYFGKDRLQPNDSPKSLCLANGSLLRVFVLEAAHAT